MRVNGTKPNAKGRASGKVYGRSGKNQKPPQGEPWCWLTRELLESDAWRTMSINARRLIDFLMLDHMSNAGTENGRLMATHEQLWAYGLSKDAIKSAVDEAEERGLVDVHRGGRTSPSLYRLTWIGDREGAAPTNRWRLYKDQKIKKPAPERRGKLPRKTGVVPSKLDRNPGVVTAPERRGASISRGYTLDASRGGSVADQASEAHAPGPRLAADVIRNVLDLSVISGGRAA